MVKTGTMWIKVHDMLARYYGGKEFHLVDNADFYTGVNGEKKRKFLAQSKDEKKRYLAHMPLFFNQDINVPNTRRLLLQVYHQIRAGRVQDMLDNTFAFIPFLAAKTIYARQFSDLRLELVDASKMIQELHDQELLKAHKGRMKRVANLEIKAFLRFIRTNVCALFERTESKTRHWLQVAHDLMPHESVVFAAAKTMRDKNVH